MKSKTARLLLFPTILLLILCFVIPLILMIQMGFHSSPETMGFAGFIQFFQDAYFVSILVRTIKLSLIVTIVCIILGLPAAYYISRSSKRWKSILIALVFFPLLTNSVVRSFIWFNILGKNGLINSLLLQLHLIQTPLKLLYNEFSIVVGLIYLFLPLMITTLLGVLDSIDEEILTAAQTLGATTPTIFFKIVLPLAVPGLLVGSVLVFSGSLTAYTTPQLLGGNSSMVLSTLVYQQAVTLGNWNQAALISTIMIAITLLMSTGSSFLSKRLSSQGENHEA